MINFTQFSCPKVPIEHPNSLTKFVYSTGNLKVFLGKKLILIWKLNIFCDFNHRYLKIFCHFFLFREIITILVLFQIFTKQIPQNKTKILSLNKLDYNSIESSILFYLNDFSILIYFFKINKCYCYLSLKCLN